MKIKRFDDCEPVIGMYGIVVPVKVLTRKEIKGRHLAFKRGSRKLRQALRERARLIVVLKNNHT